MERKTRLSIFIIRVACQSALKFRQFFSENSAQVYQYVFYIIVYNGEFLSEQAVALENIRS